MLPFFPAVTAAVGVGLGFYLILMVYKTYSGVTSFRPNEADIAMWSGESPKNPSE